MTVSEFRDSICDWYDLKNFCDEHGCSCCDDIYSDEARDEYIDNDVDYYIDHENWRYLADYLSGLSQSRNDWWQYDDCDWYCADDDMFETYKNDVEEWGLNSGDIVPDTGDEDADDEFELNLEGYEEEDVDLEQEDCDITEVFSSSFDGVSEELARLEEVRKQDAEIAEANAALAKEIMNKLCHKEEEEDTASEYLAPTDEEWNNLFEPITA